MGKKLRIENVAREPDASPTVPPTSGRQDLDVDAVKMLGIFHLGQGKWTLVEANVPVEYVQAFGDMPLPRAFDELKVRQARLYVGARR